VSALQIWAIWLGIFASGIVFWSLLAYVLLTVWPA
jgi:hypothetical protein